jgi:L-lactate dehydrogenase complex protein LldG
VTLALANGRLAVAENGAVAVLGADVRERALLHLAERLILVVPATGLVPDLHSAFRALPVDALDAHHLTWIAGPSKTADIEQTLVHGAHGPRALAVLLYEAD